MQQPWNNWETWNKPSVVKFCGNVKRIFIEIFDIKWWLLKTGLRSCMDFLHFGRDSAQRRRVISFSHKPAHWWPNMVNELVRESAKKSKLKLNLPNDNSFFFVITKRQLSQVKIEKSLKHLEIRTHLPLTLLNPCRTVLLKCFRLIGYDRLLPQHIFGKLYHYYFSTLF